jgi:hypothetical protein
MWRIAVILALFCSSLAWLYLLATQVPEYLPGLSQQKELTKFPSSLEDLRSVSKILAGLLNDDVGYSYVLVLFTSAYVFKQTFAIPGSVFLNLLAGAIFGLGLGFPMTCILTATGATFCYLLAKFAGRRAAFRWVFQKKVFFNINQKCLSRVKNWGQTRLKYVHLVLTREKHDCSSVT